MAEPMHLPRASVLRRFRLRGSAAVLVASVVAGAPGACASYQYDLSERETDAELTEFGAQVDSDRDAARATSLERARAQAELPKEPVPERVDLDTALRVAARDNRTLLAARDGLVLSVLALRNARNDVGPRLSGTISHVLAGGDDREETLRTAATVAATAVLPTGAEATVRATGDKDHGRSDLADSDAAGALTATLSQPLLRGFGAEAAYESLTDAERQTLYDVRQFELSRQDLALEIQRSYYDIVTQKQVVRNREAKLESLEFLQRRSARLFELGRVSEVDKFRATREYLTAENDLVDARQQVETLLDRFKIQLGLTTATKLDVVEAIPEPRKFDLDLRRAVDVALANRLDVMTARDEVADAERRVRLREQEVLPDLRLELTGSRSSGARHVDDLTPLDDDDYGVGLSLELPLDRVRERGALRSARVALDRARRDATLREDTVILEVRNALRELRSAESSLGIQEQIVRSEEKNVKIARLRFEEGAISNRDLTDALTSLADAQDRFVRERANVEVARVAMWRAVGLLVMNEDGTWRTEL